MQRLPPWPAEQQPYTAASYEGWDRLRVPPDLQGRLEALAAPYGGRDELERLLTPADLAYILTFPGFVYVVSPWGLEINLADHGYVEGQTYAVRSQGETIYSAVYRTRRLKRVVRERRVHVPYPVSAAVVDDLTYPVEPDGTLWLHDYRDGSTVEVVIPAGRYGTNPEDQRLVTQQPHGSYFHLLYNGYGGPTVGLLLVCNRRPLGYRRRVIARWLESLDAQSPAPEEHELFLSLCQPRSPEPLEVFFLPGNCSNELSHAEIIQHPQVQRHRHPAHVPLALHFTQSGWLTFRHLGSQLVIRDIRGYGTARLRESRDCTYCVQLDNRLTQRLHPPGRPSLLPGARENRLRAEAVLDYRHNRLPQDSLYIGLGWQGSEPGHWQTDSLTVILEF